MPTDKISLTERLTHQMFSLCMNEEGSDVVFLVEGEKIPGHRILLATRSQYFRSLLFNGCVESFKRDVPLDEKLQPFKAILIYLYTGELHFLHGKGEAADIFDVLELADKYNLQELISAISNYLSNRIDLANICNSLNAATKYNLVTVLNACFNYVVLDPKKVLTHDSIKCLTQEALTSFLKFDGLSVQEIIKFRMIVRWRQHNPDEDLKPIIANVRFTLMKLEEIVDEVQKSGLLEPTELLQIITKKTLAPNLPYRSLKANHLSVLCHSEINATQPVTGTNIVFKLTKKCLINKITIDSTTRHCNNCSCYYGCNDFDVEVSDNNSNWTKIGVGRSDGTQSINFIAMHVLYIRIRNPRGQTMKVSGIVANYTGK